MIRATTPRHYFTLPTAVENVDKALITYKQNGTILLEKSLDDCETEGENVLVVHLTQAETKLFRAGSVKIQVRILTGDGEALAGDIEDVSVKDVLNDEVMT